MDRFDEQERIVSEKEEAEGIVGFQGQYLLLSMGLERAAPINKDWVWCRCPRQYIAADCGDR